MVLGDVNKKDESKRVVKPKNKSVGIRLVRARTFPLELILFPGYHVPSCHCLQQYKIDKSRKHESQAKLKFVMVTTRMHIIQCN